MEQDSQVKTKQDRVENVHEGRLTREIETKTAKVPSIGYLSLAIAS